MRAVGSLILEILQSFKDMAKEEIRLKSRVEWLQEEDPGFTFTEPSMVEPVHNLSLEEILRDYSRGIVHSFSRQPMYDEGEDLPEDLEEVEDFSDFFQEPASPAGEAPAPQVPPEDPATLESNQEE